jgi:outer membrane lipoprotein SlyB
MRNKLLALVTAFVITGCAADISPNSYSVGSVGQVNRTVSATIISVRDVDIQGTQGVGTAAGVGAGAAAGSAIGGGTRSNIVGAIGGAVIGGVVGAMAEKGLTEQVGVEYVVQTSNGNLMTLVQGPNPRFSVGQNVLVLYGSPARIIADPRSQQ